jgi:cytosine/adenosine deaminase-related metal-dependent hydrolase
MIGEVRQAMLVSRAAGDPQAMSARAALRVATRGGAACLGRDDVGSLEVGMRADIALFTVAGLAAAGTEADLVAGVVHSPSHRVRDLFVEGSAVVRNGRLANIDEDAIAAEGRRVGGEIARR